MSITRAHSASILLLSNTCKPHCCFNIRFDPSNAHELLNCGLQIGPVFTVSGLTATPSDSDRYVNQPSQERNRAELEALFDVIGTPAWACIQAVKSDRWRNYLSNLPLRSEKINVQCML